MRTLLLICGAAGALLAIAADNIMLWQNLPVGELEAQGLAIVEAVPIDRIRLGSVLGIPAFFLQMLGILGVFLFLRRTSDLIGGLSILVAIALAFALMCGAAWHISYAPIGAVLQAGGVSQASRADLVAEISQFLVDFYYLSMAVFVVGSIGIALLCVLKMSDFPRWFAIVSPILIQPVLQILSGQIAPPIGPALFVSSINVTTLIFFVLALCAPKTTTYRAN